MVLAFYGILASEYSRCVGMFTETANVKKILHIISEKWISISYLSILSSVQILNYSIQVSEIYYMYYVSNDSALLVYVNNYCS